MTEENQNQENTNKILLDKRKLAAARALQEHFSLQPEGVIIISISNGTLKANVTEFSSVGEMLFAKKLADKFVDEAFENALVSSKKIPEEILNEKN